MKMDKNMDKTSMHLVIVS